MEDLSDTESLINCLGACNSAHIIRARQSMHPCCALETVKVALLFQLQKRTSTYHHEFTVYLHPHPKMARVE